MNELILKKNRQLATMLAALRYWQREGLMSGGQEQDIATDGDTFEALSAEEIDELCEELNVVSEEVPTVVVEMEGGVINLVTSTEPVRVVLLDADTEGGDADRIFEVDGEDVYVHDRQVLTRGAPGQDGIVPEYVQDVLKQLA